jgi:PAS domain-containing protein
VTAEHYRNEDAMYKTANLLVEHATKAHMQMHGVDRETSEYWIRSAVAEAEPAGRESEIPPLKATVSPEYVVLVDTNRHYRDVSESFCKLLGYERAELIGMKCDEVTAPGTSAIPIVFELFMRSGYMHGVWIFESRTKVRILVKYEARLRPDRLIECKMELLGAGA